MKMRQPIVRRLLRDQRGAIAIMFVLTASLMLGASLFAIDMVRYNVVQTRLSNALDTAVISAGRKLANYKPVQDGEPGQAWKDDAYRYFRANMPQGFLGSEISQDDLNITYTEQRVGDKGQFLSAQLIGMTASGELPLLSTGFLSLAGFNIGASNQAIRRVRNDLELVLALDNTGSMDYASSGWGSKTRMALLKESANGLINTVMAAAAAGGQTDGLSGAYIGLVPFTDSVNVRDIATAKQWLNIRPEQENYIDNLWGGCIVEPAGDWSNSSPVKRLPASALSPNSGFQPMLSVYSGYYTPSMVGNGYLVKDTNFSAGFKFDGPSNSLQDRRILAQVNGDWSKSTPDSAPTNFQINLAQQSQYCTVSKTMFLSQDQARLTSSVNNMTSYGGTGVPSGFLWAWRMLSPAWRDNPDTGVVGWGSAVLPRDGGAKLRKVIVLLSDGDNAPVVNRTSVSPSSSTEVFKLSYSFVKCLKTKKGNSNKCSQYDTQPTHVSLESVQSSAMVNYLSTRYSSGFTQCPINGLRIVDPTSVTPNNYSSGCTVAGTTIGYDYYSSQSSRGALTPTALDNYMDALCANIKNDPNNITIYTLTLGSDVSSSAKTVMGNCASSADTYFDVSNASDLPDVFAEIAGALTELRLIK